MTQTTSTLKVDIKSNGIMLITLARPDKLNALSETVLSELEQCFHHAANNNDVKGLLITGEGKAFCAGADINQLAEANTQSGLAFAIRGQSVFRQLETLGKPSIAAVNGFAFGGGCELAMAATVRVASEQASFGQPEVKLGVIPGYGGTVRLARLVGKGRALDLCTRGRFINAETALNWGLVTEVVTADKLLATSEDILLNITAMAPLAIQAVMESIDTGFDMSLPEAMRYEAVLFANTCSTEDKQEGVSAFLEKRAAEFKGR